MTIAFRTWIMSILPHPDLSYNNVSVISIIVFFFTIIAYILHR